jgi:hypothetical protein
VAASSRQTTDGTDEHRLRTFGSTLMLFFFIRDILFIRVICGSLATVLYGKGLPFRIPSLPRDFRVFPWFFLYFTQETPLTFFQSLV